MPVIYARAKGPVLALLSDVLHRHHGDLVEHEVTVGVLMAHTEDGEPAVKLHGYACAAVIKVTPYKQRVQGIEDAVITLDGAQWVDLSEAEQVAILDHELEHLELVRDREGEVKADDQGRPKLKLKLHDWQLGGFESIAQRHGGDALEVQAFRVAHERYYQAVFAWMDDQAPSEDTGSLFSRQEAAEIDARLGAASSAPGVPVAPLIASFEVQDFRALKSRLRGNQGPS